MRTRKKIKLSKLERMFQKARNWAFEFADTKVFLACIVFLCAVELWMMR